MTKDSEVEWVYEARMPDDLEKQRFRRKVRKLAVWWPLLKSKEDFERIMERRDDS